MSSAELQSPMTTFRPGNIPAPILTEHNFSSWTRRVLQIIGTDPVAKKIVLGTILCPAQPVAVGTGANAVQPTQAVLDRYERDLNIWLGKDTYAQSWISAGTDEQVQEALSAYDTSAAQWQYLVDTYGTVQFSSSLRIEDELITLTQQPNESLDSFYKRLAAKEQQVIALGCAVDIRRLFRVALWGLNASFKGSLETYSALLDEWVAANDGVPTRAMLTKLMDRIRSASSQPTSLSRSVEPTGQSGWVKKEEKTQEALNASSKLTCGHCGNQKHSALDCYANPESESYDPEIAARMKAKKEARKKNKGKNKSNAGNKYRDIATIVEEFPSQELLDYEEQQRQQQRSYCRLATQDVPTAISTTGKWIVDGGASSHFTYDQRDFATFTKGNFGVVTVGTGQALPVLGQGTVILRPIIDGNSTVQTLRNILFVPQLGFRLYSLETAFAQGLGVEYNLTSLIIFDKQGKTLFDTSKFGRTRFLKLTTSQGTNTFVTNVHSADLLGEPSCAFTVQATESSGSPHLEEHTAHISSSAAAYLASTHVAAITASTYRKDVTTPTQASASTTGITPVGDFSSQFNATLTTVRDNKYLGQLRSKHVNIHEFQAHQAQANKLANTH